MSKDLYPFVAIVTNIDATIKTEKESWHSVSNGTIALFK